MVELHLDVFDIWVTNMVLSKAAHRIIVTMDRCQVWGPKVQASEELP
jgi:hypothetical protein